MLNAYDGSKDNVIRVPGIKDYSLDVCDSHTDFEIEVSDVG